MRARVNGTTLHVERHGAGLPVLVMHGGLGLDHTYLRPFLDPLGAAAELIFYDHRGHGRSDRVDDWDGIDHATLVADADALRAHLGHDRVVVLGHSYGGFLACEYALRHPGHVAGLVLCSTAASFGYADDVAAAIAAAGIVASDEQLTVARAHVRNEALGTDEAWRDTWTAMLPLYVRRADPAVLAGVAARLTFREDARAHFDTHCLPSYDVTGRLGEISARTLVLGGRHDWSTGPDRARELATRIPHAERVGFEHSGHYPFLEEPGRFVDVVGDWLATVRPTATVRSSMLEQEPGQYEGYRQPGIRLSEAVDPEAEIVDDPEEGPRRVAAAERRFDLAHMVMLHAQGLVDDRSAVPVLRFLLARDERASREPTADDLRLHASERLLIRALGEEVGGRIGLGRSSGDLIAVSRRMVAREYTLECLDAVLALCDALLRRARELAGTVIPAYTHGQVAQATTVGHWLSMHAATLSRDADRLLALFDRLNRSPAGAGILSGSPLPVDRGLTASLLGFDEPINHTMDAALSQDVDVLECAAVMAILGSSLARLGDDLQMATAPEYGFVSIPDRYCDTSSIMPQKRNPIVSESLKSLAAGTTAALVGALTVERGSTGRAQMEREYSDAARWATYAACRSRAREAAPVVLALQADPEVGLRRAVDGWAQAADVATLLSTACDLPWRTAHQITGIVVRLCEERGLGSLDVTPALVDEAALLYFGRRLDVRAEALEQALAPPAAVAARTLYGGPAVGPLTATVDELAVRTAAQREATTARRTTVTRGRDALYARARMVAGEDLGTDVPAEGS